MNNKGNDYNINEDNYFNNGKNIEYSKVIQQLHESRIIKKASDSSKLLEVNKSISDKLDAFNRSLNSKEISRLNSEKEITLNKNISMSNSSKYLKIEDFYFVNNDNESYYLRNTIYEELKSKYLTKNSQDNLLNCFNKVDLNNKFFSNPNVGPYSCIERMVEMTYDLEPKFKYDIAEQIGYIKQLSSNWRIIGGDGNCFYRSVLFGWFENLIFNKKYLHFIYIANRIDKCLVNENSYLANIPSLIKKSIVNIDKALIVNIIIYIVNNLLIDKIENAYDCLIKCFNYSSSFDLSMILWLRYELFEFISDNEDKLFSIEFPVQLGNLLPFEYETEDGKFKFNEYYEKDLLKLYTYAEKLSIFVTPFIIKENIKLLMYDYGNDCNIQTKLFPSFLNSIEENNKEVNLKNESIILLYRKCHYDLLYSNTYSNFYRNILNIYHLKESLLVVDDKLIEYYKENEVCDINPEESKIFDKKQKKLNIEIKNKENKDNDNINKMNNVSDITNYNALQKIKLEKEIELLKIKHKEISDMEINKDNNKIVCYCLQCKSNLLLNNDIDKKQVCELKNIKYKLSSYDNKFCDVCLLKNYEEFIKTHKTNFPSKKELDKYNISYSLVDILKNKTCRICLKDINNLDYSKCNIFKLPCKCFTCSNSCTTILTDDLNKKIKSNGFDYNFIICNCGKSLFYSDLIDILCNTNKSTNEKYYQNLKLGIISYFAKIFNDRCMFCNSKKSEMKKYQIIEISDKKTREFFSQKINHIKCENCVDIPLDILECLLCSRIHT